MAVRELFGAWVDQDRQDRQTRHAFLWVTGLIHVCTYIGVRKILLVTIQGAIAVSTCTLVHITRD